MPKKPKHRYNDTRWTNLRRLVLEEAGHRCYVAGCTNRATSGDHIQPVEEAPHLFLVRSNVRASCIPHNSGRVSTRAAAVIRANQSRGERRPW